MPFNLSDGQLELEPLYRFLHHVVRADHKRRAHRPEGRSLQRLGNHFRADAGRIAHRDAQQRELPCLEFLGGLPVPPPASLSLHPVLPTTGRTTSTKQRASTV